MIATAISPEGRLLLFSAGLVALVSLLLLMSKWGRSSPLHEWTRLRPIDDEPEQNDERDFLTIERIREAGADLSALHRVDFFLIFKDREAAERAQADLGVEYEVSISQAVSREIWCTATVEMLIYHSLIREHGERMKALAAKYGGKYDGWGTSLERGDPQPQAADEE
ncbi:MAG: Regulator of ribonuclease activity B [Fimbriimonadaceae bacterium]|nr:Regulator of ribonuclease activity B [Fimbriimonadaceae bacterium]